MLRRGTEDDLAPRAGRNPMRGLRAGTIGGLAFGALLALGTPGQAQETGGDVWGQAGCFACHGELAEGGADPALPRGPNLRRTRLTAEQLTETIACGRVGSEMPYNLEGAYTQTACYGMPLGPAPSNVLPGAGLSAEQIGLLVDFLVADVVGKTRVTRENCALFFGGNANALTCQAL